MKILKTTMLLFTLTLLFTAVTEAQSTKQKLYDPNQNVKADIDKAVKQAKAEGKHVLLQIGGNW